MDPKDWAHHPHNTGPEIQEEPNVAASEQCTVTEEPKHTVTSPNVDDWEFPNIAKTQSISKTQTRMTDYWEMWLHSAPSSAIECGHAWYLPRWDFSVNLLLSIMWADHSSCVQVELFISFSRFSPLTQAEYTPELSLSLLHPKTLAGLGKHHTGPDWWAQGRNPNSSSIHLRGDSSEMWHWCNLKKLRGPSSVASLHQWQFLLDGVSPYPPVIISTRASWERFLPGDVCSNVDSHLILHTRHPLRSFWCFVPRLFRET